MTEPTTNLVIKPVLPVWARIILFIIAFFLLTGIFQVLGLLLLKIPLTDAAGVSEMNTEKLLFIQSFSLLPLLIIVFVFRKFIDKSTLKSLGFSIKNRGVDFSVGLLVALLIIGGGSLILKVFDVIDFSVLQFNGAEFGLSFLLFIIVALNEEIMVRGYILNNLLSTTNKFFALLISSIIFTAMHGLNSSLSWIAITNLFLAGILLGSSYVFTKNLWFPISLHLFWNFIQGPVLGYHVSGQEIDSVFAVQLKGNEMINGGGFGFEGSLVCTAMSVIMIGVIFYYYHKKKMNVELTTELSS